MFVIFRCFVFTFYHRQVNHHEAINLGKMLFFPKHRFQQIKGMNLGIEKIGLKNFGGWKPEKSEARDNWVDP